MAIPQRTMTDTHTVEGCSIDGRVDLVCASDSVRDQERHDLEGGESTSNLETLKDSGDIVGGEGNETLDGGSGRVLAASLELKLRSTLFIDA